MGKQQSKIAPEVLTDLRQSTNFTDEEIHDWYDGFKKDCPSGKLNLDEFKEVSSKICPILKKIQILTTTILPSFVPAAKHILLETVVDRKCTAIFSRAEMHPNFLNTYSEPLMPTEMERLTSESFFVP